MILASMMFIWLLASSVLFIALRRQPDRRARLSLAFRVGALAGALRAIFACAGWYEFEHTNGLPQIPGYFLAMLAMPEAQWAKARLLYQATSTVHAGPDLYASLAALLVASSLTFSLAVALAVEVLPRIGFHAGANHSPRGE